MAKFDLKLNKDKTGFVCKNFHDTEKAIRLYEKYGNQAEMEIERPVSKEFRGYYFSGVIGFIHKLGLYPKLAHLPINYRSPKNGLALKDLYHILLKKDFNGVDIPITPERTETIGMSIAVKDNVAFSDYIERINAYLGENYQRRLPTPEEYKKYRDTKGMDYDSPEFLDYFASQDIV